VEYSQIFFYSKKLHYLQVLPIVEDHRFIVSLANLQAKHV